MILSRVTDLYRLMGRLVGSEDSLDLKSQLRRTWQYWQSETLMLASACTFEHATHLQYQQTPLDASAENSRAGSFLSMLISDS